MLQPRASQEIAGADAQAATNAHQANNRQVVRAPLNATPIAAVDSNIVGQVLLRKTYFSAHRANRLANRNQDGITSGMWVRSSYTHTGGLITTGHDSRKK